MTRTEAHERTLRAIAHDGCGDMDSHRRTCRDRSDDPSAWCWFCIAAAEIEETDRVRALDRETNPPSTGAPCPECNGKREVSYCTSDGLKFRRCSTCSPRPSSPASPRPADLIEAKNGRVHEEGRSRPAVAVRSPASPECRHGRTRVDCANGETDAACLDCGAVWLDDGQGWRRASSKGGR